MQVSEQLEVALDRDVARHGFARSSTMFRAITAAIPEIKAMEARLERLETALEKSGRVLKDISTFDAGSRLLIVDTRAMIATVLAGQPSEGEAR